jgi:hypothetical protein
VASQQLGHVTSRTQPPLLLLLLLLLALGTAGHDGDDHRAELGVLESWYVVC